MYTGMKENASVLTCSLSVKYSKEPRQVFSNFTQENAKEQHSLRNAMKETHLEGSDRNTASPTESAVCERQGTGTLRSRLSEPSG